MLNVTTTQASGARVIAELIHGHGVTHVFYVPAILRDGLAELGSHDELMELGGRYHTMFEMQAARFVEIDDEGEEVVYDTLA